MIPTEETSNFAIAAGRLDCGARSPSGEQSAQQGSESPRRVAAPTSGQGGVAKGAGELAATRLSASACGKQPREYFNNRKKTTRSTRRWRGQPPRLTPEMQRTLCDLISRGMSRREAAPCLGIDHSTISRAAQRDPGFAAALKEAKRRRAIVPQTLGGGWRGESQRIELRKMLSLIPRQLVNFLPKGYF